MELFTIYQQEKEEQFHLQKLKKTFYVIVIGDQKEINKVKKI